METKTITLPLGPYSLTDEDIASNVSASLPGVYALGSFRPDGSCSVEYVGRSDEDIRERLRLHTPRSHPQFYFTYCQSEEEAYRIECELFHAFHPPENYVHPTRPQHSDLQCAMCGHRG
jgi:hypothetical protein